MITAKNPAYKPGRYYQSMLDVTVGDTSTWRDFFTRLRYRRTMLATGDDSRIHWDEEYAKKTIFRKPIVHGVALQGSVSAHLAREFPGEGTFVREMRCTFCRPVYQDEYVEFCVTVLEVDMRREVIVLNIVAHSREKLVLRGMITVRILEEVE